MAVRKRIPASKKVPPVCIHGEAGEHIVTGNFVDWRCGPVPADIPPLCDVPRDGTVYVGRHRHTPKPYRTKS